MSNPNGDVYGSDEARHGDLARRLNGAMIEVEASAVVAGVDVWSPGRRDRIHSWAVIGVVVGGAAADIEDVGVVAENGAFDERRKALRPRSNWSGSNHVGEVDNWTKNTQRKRMCSRREREVPERKRSRRKQGGGRESSDP
jgi:hypothetical protein